MAVRDVSDNFFSSRLAQVAVKNHQLLTFRVRKRDKIENKNLQKTWQHTIATEQD